MCSRGHLEHPVRAKVAGLTCAEFPANKPVDWPLFTALPISLTSSMIVKDPTAAISGCRPYHRSCVVLCRFLTAHNAYPNDSQYDDMLRLIVHSDPNKAVIWQFVPVCGKTYLMVKENRAATATGTGGWFVAVPPDSDRDKHSNYLAITSDVAKAMPVAVVPAVPGNLP